jgi:hypothetical protein
VGLQAPIAELAILGWQSIPSGPKWYDHRLYHVGVGKVPVPQLQSQQRGLSVGTMWAWSVAIVLLLFVVCVVLAFSTEIRLTPVAP